MIQELMIINQAGLALFYYNFKKNDRISDEQSLASYFDIICRFTRRNFKESLRTLTLDSVIFFFHTHKSQYHLVFKCDKQKFDKKVLETLSECIINKFLKEYKDILEDFNGEISIFKSFSEEIRKLLASDFNEFKNLLIIEH